MFKASLLFIFTSTMAICSQTGGDVTGKYGFVKDAFHEGPIYTKENERPMTYRELLEERMRAQFVPYVTPQS
jgi:hypothetical protein